MLKLYDSFSRKKKPLPRTAKKPLRLFACGPTVYDYPHIGHARTHLFFDTLVRYLKNRGRRVFYLQNITNVDDKIIDRARREGVTPFSLALRFEREYLRDMKALGIASVTHYARASDFIPHIITQVQTLLRKGYAYRTGDGYYFNIAKFPRYGKLSGRTAAQAEDAVSRIDESVKKRNRGDFCLWKFSMRMPEQSSMRKAHANKIPMRILDGEPVWLTPLGWGRPGWHIEDTAISEAFFGPQYEIHGGGADLKFPHHEAEIAQQEAASGKRPFVKIWMHAGTLLVEGKKMSKSLRNFITIRDFLKEHRPEVMRWIVLQHHYRSPVDYTPALATQAESSLATVAEFLEKLRFRAARRTSGKPQGVRKRVREAEAEFHNAMENDFNTPLALACLFRLGLEFQKKVWDMEPGEATLLRRFIAKALGMLGITIPPPKIPPRISVLAKKRELCRRNKQFAQADALRVKIEGLGYRVEDTPTGPLVQSTKFQIPNGLEFWSLEF